MSVNETGIAKAMSAILLLLGDNLGALTSNRLRTQRRRPIRAEATELDAMLGEGKHARIRCHIKKAYQGHIDLYWPMNAAIALTQVYRGTKADDVAQKREALSWTSDDDTTFEELAVLLTASVQEALQSVFGSGVEAELDGQEILDGALSSLEDKGPYYAIPFSFLADDRLVDTALLTLPLAEAEKIEGGPINFDDPDEDEYFDDFEPAEIRGAMAAFVHDPDLVRTLRRACRRVGLTFDKRPKSEVPNPAFFADMIVVLEIGLGQERRYEWCRRLKRAPNTYLVLLVHEPTRAAAARAFRSGADAMLNAKSREREISDKLERFASHLAPTA
ncbi:MAG: hypothetical protein H6832_04255 [Planctomycetes bacterium]|nr:hypothetical protein [Planctomycetota bacterium]MCB9917594.1 hypothetical protein [Planctomycetota bacterium]